MPYCRTDRRKLLVSVINIVPFESLSHHIFCSYVCDTVILDFLNVFLIASGSGTTPTGQQLLKPQPPLPLPDMQPFFVKEYVKSESLFYLISDSINAA